MGLHPYLNYLVSYTVNGMSQSRDDVLYIHGHISFCDVRATEIFQVGYC